MYTLELTPQARSDIRAAHDWYLEQSETTALRFEATLADVWANICEHPLSYAAIYKDARATIA